ncbi:Mbeg1-like protein [Paenibacillus segetis]|uniref:DUF2974 domain-containing protein n=1 Tax=Paenibacillus segetis TaxID=1325360 RepID=A0ABQ1Y3B6_9BACL|nr:Mbeg1-like protein [Paenibacillus segetis]GGH11141.1 hypothetical protein GCM10008013_02820 [Paenibacillus segetis]
MAELSESQLLLLDNLIYLKDVANKNDMKVREIVESLLHQDGLDKSRNEKKIGTEDEYPCKMKREEWIAILQAIEKDSQLMDLTITNGQTGVMYDKNGQVIIDKDSKQPLEVGMRVATFVDPQGEATVVFRGTGGDYEWYDNGQGGYLSETDQQLAALKYVDGLEYDNITVTGHSKGGNKTQFVTILSDKVKRGISFDGQGFSEEFLEKYKDQIKANAHKITSISAKDDFVNCLLNPIANTDKIKYINTDEQEKFIYNHKPNIMLNESGQLRGVATQGVLGKLINDFTIYINANMIEPHRSYAIDGLLALMENGDEGFEPTSKFQTITGGIAIAEYLDDYVIQKAADGTVDFAELIATGWLATRFPQYFMDDFQHSIEANVSNFNFMVELFRVTRNFIAPILDAQVQAIRETFRDLSEKLVNFVKNAVKSAWNSVVDWFKKAGSAIKNTWNTVVDKAKKGISNLVNNAKEEITKKYLIFTASVSFITGLPKAIVDQTSKKNNAKDNFVKNVSGGYVKYNATKLAMDFTRMSDLQAKFRNAELQFESTVRQIISEVTSVTSSVSRSYSESNVQRQIQTIQRACDRVTRQQVRVMDELKRKIQSLTYAQEQYIKIEEISSGVCRR